MIDFSKLVRSQVTGVWAGLMVATAVSFAIGTDAGLGSYHARSVGGTIVLAIAFLKVRFIGLYFMELRTAPLALRILFEGWVLCVGGAVIGLFLVGQ